MCGIIGYTGDSVNATEIVIAGLKKLEYRGYDSSGICYLSPSGLNIKKYAGYIANLENKLSNKKIKSKTAIGHTRWATHGHPNNINAHPHFSCNKEIAIVHNGIIENYTELRKKLKTKGHKFLSDTDSEIIAHLFEDEIKCHEPLIALKNVLSLLKGSYAIAAMINSLPNTIFFAKLNSPLIISKSPKGLYLASDITAIIKFTKKFIPLDDNEFGFIDGNNSTINIFDNKLNRIEKKIKKIDWNVSEAEKGGYPHFMLKEIHEQPKALESCIFSKINSNKTKVDLGADFKLSPTYLKSVNRIEIVACGTAWHAGIAGKYFIEQITKIPTSVNIASEFRYATNTLNKKTLLIAISQSGETADTLAAIKLAKQSKSKVLGITNVFKSSLARSSDSNIYTLAGPEIGVAATKSYTTQLASILLFSVYLADLLNGQTPKYIKSLLQKIYKVPSIVNKTLQQKNLIKKIAYKYADYYDFLFIARKFCFPNALEGALKLKEISYLHAEGYAGGEMKHGPLALIDKKCITVGLTLKDSVYEKMISNLQEVCSRHGRIISIATKGDKKIKNISKDVIYIPECDEIISTIISVIPLQLFSYFVAVKNKKDVDKPRNLAKSVTVE